MDRLPKRHDADTDSESLAGSKESQGHPADEASKRQAAASYLRAARVTDDAAEREALRRQAAELLTGRRSGRRTR